MQHIRGTRTPLLIQKQLSAGNDRASFASLKVAPSRENTIEEVNVVLDARVSNGDDATVGRFAWRLCVSPA